MLILYIFFAIMAVFLYAATPLARSSGIFPEAFELHRLKFLYLGTPYWPKLYLLLELRQLFLYF